MNLREFAAHLARAERDVIELSRKDAARLLAIPDRKRRYKAYKALVREWEKNGERLRPEDDARIEESLFAGDIDGGELPIHPDSERRVAGQPETLAEHPTKSASPTIAAALVHWRKIHHSAANGGGPPRAARRAAAVCGLLVRVCDTCGARETDRINGPVGTVEDAAKSVRVVGQETWIARKHPLPTAGWTVGEAAAWWHALSVRICDFDMPAVLVAADEAESLSEASARLKHAAGAAIAARDQEATGDPGLLRAAGKEWRVFLMTVDVAHRHRALVKAGLGGEQMPRIATNDLRGVFAALRDLEARVPARAGVPKRPDGQGRAEPHVQQAGRLGKTAGQEEKGTAKRTANAAPPSTRSRRRPVARLLRAVRRWLGLSSA